MTSGLERPLRLDADDEKREETVEVNLFAKRVSREEAYGSER